MMRGSRRLIIGSCLCSILAGCKGEHMGWEKRPRFEEQGLSTGCLRVAEGGRGFLGASLVTEESMLSPDWKKSLSMDTAVILLTTDDWVTRKVFEVGTGEVTGVFAIGKDGFVALNQRINQANREIESRFLDWAGAEWKETSKLPLRSLKVWSAGDSVLFAAGYPDGADSTRVVLSMDGGKTWKEMKSFGSDPLETKRGKCLALEKGARLVSIQNTDICAMDLTQDVPVWNSLGRLPQGFSPHIIAAQGGTVAVLGQGPDMKWIIVLMDPDGKLSSSPCMGLPEALDPDGFRLQKAGWVVVGTIEEIKHGATVGYSHHIYRSPNGGSSWRDLELPLPGSLKAIDFGEDGRIWAMAAGNRMQVFKP
jgi:hypothetical protein